MPDTLSQLIYIEHLVRILKPMKNNRVIKSWYIRCPCRSRTWEDQCLGFSGCLMERISMRLVPRKSLIETVLQILISRISAFLLPRFPQSQTGAGKYICIKGLGYLSSQDQHMYHRPSFPLPHWKSFNSFSTVTKASASFSFHFCFFTSTFTHNTFPSVSGGKCVFFSSVSFTSLT